MGSINERFREIRKLLNFSQEGFAKEIGISRAHVSNIENGNDNPSSTLIKLIGVKFNISEQWLIEGTGSPDPGWNIETDEGAIAKYNAMRVSFEHTLRNRKGDNLANTVEAFAFFTSLISMNAKGLNEDDTQKYVEYIRLVIDNFEKLTFKAAMKDVVPSKSNAKYRILYKDECNKYVNTITGNVKNATNLFLQKYGDEMKI